jgi:glutaredoxin
MGGAVSPPGGRSPRIDALLRHNGMVATGWEFRMNPHVVIAAFCMASLLATAAAAQSTVHRWVDKDGKVHYSDAPPPKDAKDATQKRMGGGQVEVENLPYATQVAMRRNPVVLYTGSACGDACASARELLSRRGVPFSEKDAQNSAADREALKSLVGVLEVPVLVIGENPIKGYGEQEWQQALDGAGYPRTRLPGQASAPRAPPAVPAKAPPAAGGEAPKRQ